MITAEGRLDLITVEEMDNLPDDPVAAFVQLERLCRTRLNQQLETADDRWDQRPVKQEYMTVVTAAASAFCIPGVTEYTATQFDDADFNFHYREAISAATKLGVTLRLRRAAETVALPQGTKARLKKHVEALRIALQSSGNELPERRRKSLEAKLNDFSAEIDRERSSVSKMLGATAAVAAACVGITSAEDAIIKLPETVAAISVLIGREKSTEEEATPPPIPLPAPPKKLPAPSDSKENNSAKALSGFAGDLDDDVPF